MKLKEIDDFTFLEATYNKEKKKKTVKRWMKKIKDPSVE